MVYNHFKVHNVLAIMFDTCYKHMKCIQDFVDNSIAIEIVVKYNVLIVCQSLYYYRCTIIWTLLKKLAKLVTTKNDDCLFCQIVSVDDVIISTLKNKLQLF
jgi:hypothetical protein